MTENKSQSGNVHVHTPPVSPFVEPSFLQKTWMVVKHYGPAFLLGSSVGVAGTYAVMHYTSAPETEKVVVVVDPMETVDGVKLA